MDLGRPPGGARRRVEAGPPRFFHGWRLVRQRGRTGPLFGCTGLAVPLPRLPLRAARGSVEAGPWRRRLLRGARLRPAGCSRRASRPATQVADGPALQQWGEPLRIRVGWLASRFDPPHRRNVPASAELFFTCGLASIVPYMQETTPFLHLVGPEPSCLALCVALLRHQCSMARPPSAAVASASTVRPATSCPSTSVAASASHARRR